MGLGYVTYKTADASHRARGAAELLADEEDEIVSVDAEDEDS